MKKIATFIGLLLASVLLMQFVWRVSEPAKKDDPLSPEKINLALRRTADQLLKEEGDSTSRIPPVEKTAPNVWLIRLERNFDYDRLPAILKASFDLHQIKSRYDVAILRCNDGTLLLGYTYVDTNPNEQAVCGGRSPINDCFNLQVTFSDGEKKQSGLPLTGWFFSALLAVSLYSLGRKLPRNNTQVVQTPQVDTDWIRFGQSRLDVTNQVLVCGGATQQLTYREAKLLHLFVQHPNQVLKRSFILDNVWADEGILVGRSVDMFVSRLRKMLSNDSALRIVAVHGVGYRLEVAQDAVS